MTASGEIFSDTDLMRFFVCDLRYVIVEGGELSYHGGQRRAKCVPQAYSSASPVQRLAVKFGAQCSLTRRCTDLLDAPEEANTELESSRNVK